MEQFKGYYRYPTIHEDRIVFVAEDDLWSVDARGGTARRLTSNLGEISNPSFSEDGKWLAFVGREEGHPEVYVMPSEGGTAKRVTYLGNSLTVVGWREGKVLFASNHAQHFFRLFDLFAVDAESGGIEKLPFGPSEAASFGEKGVVIGRNAGDPARWKRYRGGRAGELWIDENGTGEFRKLVDLGGNLANPMWIKDRIYFISDHEKIGNIYSCLTDGTDLRKHTGHTEFYARNASSDGKRIVYHCGADVYLFDPAEGESSEVGIEYRSPGVQRNRKFVDVSRYLEDFSPSKDGRSVAIDARGKSFTFFNWEGPVIRHGKDDGIRHRLTRWLNDGVRVLTLSDESGEERFEIHRSDGTLPPEIFDRLDIGRPYEVKVSPAKDEIALTNHRNEILTVDLETGKVEKIERSEYGPVEGFDWSADGRWIAYSVTVSRTVSVIKIYDTETKESRQVTSPVLRDIMPAFDPEGKYLYFLSHRVFNPVYDNMTFDLGFPKGMKPYAITLGKDVKDPFVPHPSEKKDEEKKDDKKEEVKKIEIDFDGIKDRIVPFPVAEGKYSRIGAIKGKVFYTSYPVTGALGLDFDDDSSPVATLKTFDLETLEESTYLDGITTFRISGDGSSLALRVGNRLRVLKAKSEAPKESAGEKPGRKTGWIDLSRVRVSVDPAAEWWQMLKEAWRLQKYYYWVDDMAGIDWDGVLERYLGIVGRVASRSEFSDLIWEVQGELGTSHAYEMGGDYRARPEYRIGFLGADFRYDEKNGAYVVEHIIDGDVWDEKYASPLKRPGTNVTEGMFLLAVNGQKLDAETPPEKLLVNQAGQEVQLTVAENPDSPRNVFVKTVPSNMPIRYREWVESNRRYVHEKTGGRVGYIHIPDMVGLGFAEFHRYFLSEMDHEGIVVDVRFNRGGHVSYLLLEKLARKRLGYDLTRWMGASPYPEESAYGSIVALTNEHAGSDGDIFSHSFKLMKLGKLVGRRTWGGVVGIWPRNWLVDGTITTQPEMSFWFKDVGWGVENYGTDPDIEADITPQDYANGKDTQLDRAIEAVIEDMDENQPLRPEFGEMPKKS